MNKHWNRFPGHDIPGYAYTLASSWRRFHHVQSPGASASRFIASLDSFASKCIHEYKYRSSGKPEESKETEKMNWLKMLNNPFANRSFRCRFGTEEPRWESMTCTSSYVITFGWIFGRISQWSSHKLWLPMIAWSELKYACLPDQNTMSRLYNLNLGGTTWLSIIWKPGCQGSSCVNGCGIDFLRRAIKSPEASEQRPGVEELSDDFPVISFITND
jgi:hypothetical protein